MKRITKVTMFADCVMTYFNDVIGGFASEWAYYELLEATEEYLFGKSEKKFLDLIGFTFGIEKKDLKNIEESYNKQLKEYEKYFG